MYAPLPIVSLTFSLAFPSQVLCKPNTVKPVIKFEASIYCLTKEEGGRHTPFFTKYRPQFFFRTADVTGAVTLNEERQARVQVVCLYSLSVRMCKR